MSNKVRVRCVSPAGVSSPECVTRTISAVLLTSAAILYTGSLTYLPIASAQQVTPASTQGGAVSFSIPAQPLASALNAFIRISGWQVGYSTASVSGSRSQAVSGTMPPAQALQMLLSGTGVSVRMTGPTTATLIGTGASGNDTTAAVDGAIALDTIDVSGGGGTAADAPYMTPGSSGYISAEQIQRVPPISAGDIFRDVPGVMSGSNHNGTAIDVNIRGLQGMNRVKVMVDGTQQETSTYRGYAGPDNRSYVDTDFLSGVAVEKGPNAGPYGSGAIGGVIDMRTLEADDLIRPGESYGGRVRMSITGNMIDPRFNNGVIFSGPTGLEYSSNEFLSSDNWRGSIATAARLESFEIVGAFSRRQRGNYFAGSNHGDLTYPFRYRNGNQWATQYLRYSRVEPGQEVPNTSEDTTSALLKVLAKWDGGQSLQLGFNSYESVQGIVFPSNVMFRPPQQYPLGKISSQRYNARYRWNPNDNDLVNLSFNLWATTLGSEDPADTGLGKRAIIDSKGWGGELWNSSIIETSAGRLTLTYGAEYSSTDSERESEYPPAAPVVQTYGRREIGGVYFKGALELTKWLTIDAGARYDAFKSSGASLNNYYDWATPPYLFTTMLSGGLEAEAFSPSAGVTIMPWDGVQLFARFAEGWRPPSIVEAVGSGSEAGIIPNLALRPEQSTGWEVGINIRRDSVFLDGDKLRAKVAYFDNDYTDYIARRLDLQTGNAMFINLPGAKISGYEASLSYDMGHVFAEGRFNYFDNVEYCYNEPTYGLSGCSAHAYPGDWRGGYVQPKYSGSVTVGTRLFDERLTLGARVNFFGSSAIDLPPWNSTDLPVVWAPEEIYDAFASYKVTDAASLNLSVENLMDRYYISPLAVAQIPSPGRTATLTFELKF